MQKKFVQLRLTDLAYTLTAHEKRIEYMYHYQMRLYGGKIRGEGPRCSGTIPARAGRPRILAYRLPVDRVVPGSPFMFTVLIWSWETSRWVEGSKYEYIEEMRSDWRSTLKECDFEEVHGSDIIPMIRNATTTEGIPEYTITEFALNA